jgi:predicted amidophosphoribosyltransferase
MTRIDELPIPDWGLLCPHCSTPVAGLQEHRCGNCGDRFNLLQLIARHRPIPDVGLRCPGCDYNLAGLLGSRCPECGRWFVLSEVIEELIEAGAADRVPAASPHKSYLKTREPVFTGRERPLPDFGLCCEGCDQPLAGAPDDRCPRCGEQFTIPDPGEHGRWMRIEDYVPRELLVQLKTLLVGAEIPYIADATRTASDTGHAPHIVAGLQIPREFFFDALYTFEEAMRPPADFARRPWVCPACAEDVPAGFEICWNCGRSHPDAENIS